MLSLVPALLVNIDHIGKVKRRTRALAKSNGGNSGFESFPPLLKATTLFTFQRPHASDAMEYVIHGTTAHGADRLSRGLSSRGEDIVEFLRRRLLGRSRCGTTKAPSDLPRVYLPALMR
jgi:hypothetical protein